MHYTQEQKEAIIKLYQDGYSIAAIATELKHGKNSINKLLREEGIVRSCNLFSKETEEQIVQEYLEGNPLSALGKKKGYGEN